MNKQQYNGLISESVRLQALIKRHTASIKAVDKDLANAMRADKIEVYQGKDGTATYKSNTSNTTTYDLVKLFKQLKFTVFLKMISFNATKAKPLISSGVVDSKLIDSITSTGIKTSLPKLKVQGV